MLDKKLKAQYERLFRDDYKFNQDTMMEQLGTTTSEGVKKDEIDDLCNNLMEFMRDVKSTSLNTR